MKLDTLLSPWIHHSLPELEIESITNDSREVKPGSLFLAYPGFARDGRDFVKNAIDAKASAILYEAQHANLPADIDICTIPMSDLSTQLGAIASRFYQNPSMQMNVTGVTGTNGKTTIAYQLAQAHHLLSKKAAYIGTIGEGDPNQLNLLANTTPDALQLQKLFAIYHQKDVEQVCMEVSSHALTQGRVNCVDFKQAIFTNLTLDHLDYHRTMEAYVEAKSRLFQFDGLQFALLNEDDSYSSLIRKKIKKSVKTLNYAVYKDADIRAIDWEISLKGSALTVESPWGRVQLKTQGLGFFNVYNSLAIFGSLMLSNYRLQDVVSVFPLLCPAPGRMEVVSEKPYVLVDYAHTPDALDNVLSTLRAIKEGRIIVVFGCGGDRDKSKRPIMGKIASEKADRVMITSDNPRMEDPMAIMNEIEAGIVGQNYHKIMNREEAILKALEFAKPEDIILIAGKGHEAYQQIGSVKHPFSDQRTARTLINRLIALPRP